MPTFKTSSIMKLRPIEESIFDLGIIPRIVKSIGEVQETEEVVEIAIT